MSPHFRTLAEAVGQIGRAYPENGFTFQDQHGHEVTYTFPEIERITARRAAGLQALGLKKGDRIGLVIIDPEHFVLTFLAAVRIGVVPVPIYPPPYLGKLDGYMQQTAAILKSAAPSVLITSDKVARTLEPLSDRVDSLARVIPVTELPFSESEPTYPDISPDDVVFLQYTSGSTMEPRGVMVTNKSLISNVTAFIVSGLNMDPKVDSGATWLPLYHDMGLIGFVLGPIVFGISVVFIPTMRFVKNANVWMETIQNHRASVSFAPNFAFALAMRRARPAELDKWDLSCLKALGCGAEPIQADTMFAFARLFSDKCRLSPNAIMPAYGMAEATLAVTMKPLHETLRIRRVDKMLFETTGVSRLANSDAPFQTHVSCGVPFPGHELAIMNSEGMASPECVEGEVWIKGPSVGAGYFNNESAWDTQMRGDWFRTGDLGYLADGELYITGRIKDLIILNGRNVHPQEIEWIVSRVEGVRPNCVAAFSCPTINGEGLVIVLETREREHAAIEDRVEEAVFGATLSKPVGMICLPPSSLPRTSSGKLKRQQVRAQYLSQFSL